MGKFRTLTEILGGLAISGGFYRLGFYRLGELFGKRLHDLLAYGLPKVYLGNYSWFNYEQYIRMYQQYLNGSDKAFGYIFDLTFGGLALALYVYTILKFREDRYYR